jgi:hypothetical protein
VQNVATVQRPAADLAVRRFLRIPDGPAAPAGAAERAFSTSILVSATRCILTYIVVPWVLPLVGFAKGVGLAVGIPIAVAAIVAYVLGVRRFFAADHKWRWAYLCLAVVVTVLMLVMIGKDIASIVG